MEKNNVKAFKYFEQLSKEDYADGMIMLGYCYINGIGTEINKERHLSFIKKLLIKEMLMHKTNLDYCIKVALE